MSRLFNKYYNNIEFFEESDESGESDDNNQQSEEQSTTDDKTSEKVTKLISMEGAMFRRYVWTITPLIGLSQHPEYSRPTPNDISDLYFRTETQTTVGLGNDISLFFCLNIGVDLAISFYNKYTKMFNQW